MIFERFGTVLQTGALNSKVGTCLTLLESFERAGPNLGTAVRLVSEKCRLRSDTSQLLFRHQNEYQSLLGINWSFGYPVRLQCLYPVLKYRNNQSTASTNPHSIQHAQADTPAQVHFVDPYHVLHLASSYSRASSKSFLSPIDMHSSHLLTAYSQSICSSRDGPR